MGGRGDSWAKCIAHREGDKVVIDPVRALVSVDRDWQ
jgi:hypothetical protein